MGKGLREHREPLIMREIQSRIPLSELKGKVGEELSVSGVVDTIRDQKAVQFIILRDREAKLQIVNVRSEQPETAEEIAHLTPESVIEVEGKLVENKASKTAGLELLAASLKVLSRAEALPIDENSTIDLRLDNRHVDLRRPEVQLIFEVQTTAEQKMREIWIREGFREIHSPKLMGAASESGAELFELEYFDTKAYLAQSPQFYKQMAMAGGMEKVFELSPVFRAEPSMGRAHATEFISVDMEMAYIKDVEEVMQFEERWLAEVIAEVKERHGEAIVRLHGTEIKVPEIPFPRLKYAEATELLNNLGHTSSGKHDLNAEGERLLGKWAQEEHEHEFVFITHWPKELRPFYHMQDEAHSLSFDLLWRGIEITTGAQREHRYERLTEQAERAGVKKSTQDYRNFFRHGCPPHGGLGFGLARMLMVMLNQEGIRDTTLVHRSPVRLTP